MFTQPWFLVNICFYFWQFWYLIHKKGKHSTLRFVNRTAVERFFNKVFLFNLPFRTQKTQMYFFLQRVCYSKCRIQTNLKCWEGYGYDVKRMHQFILKSKTKFSMRHCMYSLQVGQYVWVTTLQNIVQRF